MQQAQRKGHEEKLHLGDRRKQVGLPTGEVEMAETAPRLYVSNLPYVAQKVEIERLFADSNVPL